MIRKSAIFLLRFPNTKGQSIECKRTLASSLSSLSLLIRWWIAMFRAAVNQYSRYLICVEKESYVHQMCNSISVSNWSYVKKGRKKDGRVLNLPTLQFYDYRSNVWTTTEGGCWIIVFWRWTRKKESVRVIDAGPGKRGKKWTGVGRKRSSREDQPTPVKRDGVLDSVSHKRKTKNPEGASGQIQVGGNVSSRRPANHSPSICEKLCEILMRRILRFVLFYNFFQRKRVFGRSLMSLPMANLGSSI